jgi:hypothetical protein
MYQIINSWYIGYCNYLEKIRSPFYTYYNRQYFFISVFFMAAEIEIGQILQDFTVIMIIAGAMAMISYRFKQPMVIGYIGAGMIIETSTIERVIPTPTLSTITVSGNTAAISVNTNFQYLH